MGNVTCCNDALTHDCVSSHGCVCVCVFIYIYMCVCLYVCVLTCVFFLSLEDDRKPVKISENMFPLIASVSWPHKQQPIEQCSSNKEAWWCSCSLSLSLSLSHSLSLTLSLSQTHTNTHTNSILRTHTCTWTHTHIKRERDDTMMKLLSWHFFEVADIKVAAATNVILATLVLVFEMVFSIIWCGRVVCSSLPFHVSTSNRFHYQTFHELVNSLALRQKAIMNFHLAINIQMHVNMLGFIFICKKTIQHILSTHYVFLKGTQTLLQ